tara:strand:+ start:2126 stop:2311 length:186 start_codon:yes stop_codon:yes gene_type:complete
MAVFIGRYLTRAKEELCRVLNLYAVRVIAKRAMDGFRVYELAQKASYFLKHDNEAVEKPDF